MGTASFGLRLVSVANEREHWRAKAKRTQEHRWVGAALTTAAGANDRTLNAGPVEITLTRIAPRELDDDNLASACKALRDGVADALGVPDNDRRIAWRYAQRKGAPREYGVEVAIISPTAPAPK